MFNEQQREFIRRAAVNMQIIVATLALGVLALLGVALVVRAGRAGAMGPLSYVALGAIALDLIAWAVVPTIVVRQGLKSIAEGKPPVATMSTMTIPPEVGEVAYITQLFLTRLIVAAALLEGVAFLNAVAYLVEGAVWTLLAAGLLFLMIAGHVPTRTRVEDWVQQSIETLEQMRGASQQ
jgi:hypothetical protein